MGIFLEPPKIHKSKGLLKCFHRVFYFNLFFASKYLLSGHNFLRSIFFFFQKLSFIDIFHKQPHVH